MTPDDALLTLAEQSDFEQTGRGDEVERLCHAFAARWPQAVHHFEFGRSAEGRPLHALIVSRNGALTAFAIKQRKLPLLMLQAGIHPGESDGKDAGFIALRQLLLDTAAGNALARIAVLFIPAFNSDGHERVGRWNRPNQVGPIETGWRATGQNLNLNRDYTKADAPEMQAMLQLIDTWDPLICADLHVTDGANFEPDISIQVEPIHQGDAALFGAGRQLRDDLIERLEKRGSLPLPFYPDLYVPDDPASGFQLTVYSPRFSTGYFAYRNRFSVLVETHSWKDYATRVRVTRNTIIELAAITAAYGSNWLALAQQADINTTALSGQPVALDYAASWRESTQSATTPLPSTQDEHLQLIDFRGYAYSRTLSPISGELVTTYDPTTPQLWRVPLRKHTAPSLTIAAPKGGYIISPGHAYELGERLTFHGIAYEAITEASDDVPLHVFRAARASFADTPFEGRMRVSLMGEWSEERVTIAPDSLYVPMAQPLARLAMALLEPQAPDSFAAWGFLNAWFEQKEYLEPYVIEIIAREMLNDAQVAAEFKQRLADPEFARDPIARRDFFQRRHPSWDQRFNLYPVYRSETPLASTWDASDSIGALRDQHASGAEDDSGAERAMTMERAEGKTIMRVDLREIISPYIGETEKNLRRIFEAAQHSDAIVLFEEGDELFDRDAPHERDAPAASDRALRDYAQKLTRKNRKSKTRFH